MLCGIGAAWRRLVFYYKQPKFQVIAAADPSLGPSEGQRRLSELVASRRACGSCIDEFTSVWTDRLLAQPKRAQACLDMLAAATPVCSAKVERKHLLGQEQRKARSRGLAPSATKLGKTSYLRGVAVASRRKSASILKQQLGGARRNNFAQLMRHRCAKPRKANQVARESKRRQRLQMARRNPHASCAWHQYRRHNWTAGVRPCTPEGKAEFDRLLGEWKREREHVRRHMHALAGAHKTSMIDAEERSLVSLQSPVLDVGSQHSKRVCRRRASLRVMSDIKKHTAFSSGIDDFNCALKPGLVDMTSSDLEVQTSSRQIFAHDPELVQNPPGTALPQQVCSGIHGGLCLNDEGVTSKANAIVKGVYKTLKAKGLDRLSLPLLFGIGEAALVGSDSDAFKHFMIVDMHGVGENVICVGLCGGHTLRLARDAHQLVAVSTMHCLVSRALRLSGDVTHVPVVCYEFEDDIEEGGLAFKNLAVRWTEPVSTALRAGKRQGAADLPFGLGFAGSDLPWKPHDADEDSIADSEASGALEVEPDEVPAGDISASSAGEDKPPELEPLPPPPGDGRRAPGLWGLEKAPSSRSTCFICNCIVPAGSWRLNYQTRLSKTLADAKRVHVHCIDRLPAGTRRVDILWLRHFAEKPDLSAELYELLDNLLDTLSPEVVAASGSGA